MIKFETGEFEIAIVTYNRARFVNAWLEYCYEPAMLRNIAISVYDSSTNDETQKTVDEFNAKQKKQLVNYQRVDNVVIGYKPMLPILNTKSSYIWVSGDSRYHDFDELDEKLFSLVKNKSIDFAVINFANQYMLPNVIYDNKDLMIKDCFVSSTCIGMSIYRTSIFDPIRNDQSLMDKYDKLFKDNYGNRWLGYFYSIYAMGEYKTALINVRIKSIMNRKKVQSWAVRFYGCWAEDLCSLVDKLPDSYVMKDRIPRDTWSIMNLNSISYGYKARKYGDLNKDKYIELINNGILQRLTDNLSKVKFFATAPIFLINSVYLARRSCSFLNMPMILRT